MKTFQHSQRIIPGLFDSPAKNLSRSSSRQRKRRFGSPRKPGEGLIFLVSFMVYSLGIFPSVLYALPSDPSVQAGSATINQPSPESLVIQQSTNKAIIDWRAFGIGSNEQVEFQLPTSSGVTLNRVTGNERSDIFGRLSSNGNLMLINPNGILFGAGAQIDVHGLVATTSNISNQDFMAGRFNFNIPSDRGGIVVNRGRITAAQGGLVALVAPGVQNNGIIEARLGKVTLASGNTFTLDLYGDQLINLGLDSKITQQITGLDGEVLSALISNSGGIYADGGTVRLEVNAARDVVDQVINMSGIIQAKTAVEQNGAIVLRGGDEGRVHVSGTLDASGVNEGESGGKIHVFGERIGLFESALLNVSGYSGGGTVLVGGDYQGLGEYPTATDTFVDEGVSIFADALFSGDGGRSIFWANRRMRFFGSVFARGGRKRGDGGFIEVSGKEELFFDGWADTSAPNGLTGTLLLDPTDIIIADGSGTPSASGAATFTTYEETLEALSGNTNIELLATNSITLNDLSDNVLSLNISGSLTMLAGVGGITFQDTNDKIRSTREINLTATGGNLTLGSLESIEGNINLQGNNLILSGTLSSVLGTTTLLSSNGGTIGLGTGAGTFSVSGAELQNITAANLVVGDGTTGSITVDGITAANSNNIAGTTTLNATKAGSKATFNNDSTFNGLKVNADDDVTVSGNLSTKNNSLTIKGKDIALTGTLNSGTGTTTLLASNGGTIGVGAGAGTFSLSGTELQKITAGGLTIGDATNGDVTVDGVTAANSGNIAGTTTLNATKAGSKATFNNDSTFNGLNVNANDDVTVSGNLSTGNNSLSLEGGDIVLTGTLDSGTATTTLLASNGGTIGIGAGAGSFSLSGTELQNITAGGLTIGDATNGDVTVDGVTAANSGNIAGTTTLNATKAGSSVTLANSTSTFKTLNVNANSGITLNSDLTTSGSANLNAGTGITLANGIAVSSGGTLSLSTTSGGINAQGGVSVSSANGITLNDDFTSSGSTTFDADSNDDGTGGFTVAGGKTVTTGNNALSIRGNDIVLTGSLNSGTGTTTLLASNGGTIGIGAGAGTFSLSDSELGRITAGGLTIGDATNGDVTVDGVTAANSGNIAGTTTLNATKAGSKATFNNDSRFNALNVNADDDVTVSGNLSTGNNSLSLKGGDIVLTGTLNSGTGTTTLLASNGGTIGIGAGAGSFSLSGSELQNITAGGLTIGDATNGNVTVDGVTSANSGNITGTTTLNATKAGSKATFNNDSTFNALNVNADDDVTVSGNLSTGNNSLSLEGGDIVLTGTLNSGTATTTLQASNGGTIGIGAGAGSFSLSGTELQNISAGGLTIGDATNGDITVDGVTAANTGNIAGTTTLNATKSTSNVTFTSPSTFSGPVSLNAGANATVTTNDSLNLATSTVGGNLVVTVAGGNGLIVSGTQTAGGTISMTADDDITLTGGLFTSSASGSAVTLNSNNGGIFDGDITGALDINAANGGLVVNSVTGFGTPANAIETKVASVDINNTGVGAINFFETDSLNIVNINHSGTGDVTGSYFGTLTGEPNAAAANGIVTFTSRDSGGLVLPEFGKTLSEISTEQTVSVLNNLESNYFFGNQPPASEGKTVTEIFSSPESGPFVTNVFNERFQLLQVAKKSRKTHKGLRGFASFWEPLQGQKIEMVKRPSKRSLAEEAKLKKKKLLRKKKKQAEKKSRSKFKNARVKRVGDAAALANAN